MEVGFWRNFYYYYYYYYYYYFFYHSLCWCSFCASAGRKPCTYRASVTPVNHSVHTLSIIICIIIIIIKKKTPVLNTTTTDVSLEAPKGDGPFQSTLSQPME